jgi:hypothetical protein
MPYVEYDVIESIAVLSETGRSRRELTLTSWNGDPPKLDVRIWIGEGYDRAGKGIALSRSEARALRDALDGLGDAALDPAPPEWA